MGVSCKKLVEVCCGLHPLVAIFAPLALGFSIQNFDDFAWLDGIIFNSSRTDLISDGFAGAELIEGDVLVFVLALDSGDVVVGGGEAGVGVLEVTEVVTLRF